MKNFPLLALLSVAPLVAYAHPGHDDDDHDAPAATAATTAGAPAHEHVHTHEEAHTIIALSANRRANLALTTEPAGPAKIRKTVFALGVIATDPAGRSAASVRIPGRVIELRVSLGSGVKKGDTLAIIEARSPGAEHVPVVALADGTVDEVLTQVGEPVTADAPLLRLSDHTRPYAEARIPQNVSAKLIPGKTRALFTPEGGSETELTLDSLTPFADAQTGTVTARFRPDNRDGSLSPGRRASFRIILEEKELPLTVPRESVQGDGGDLYVFVEEKPGIYEKHPVVLGEGDDRRVAITGPDAGEQVVVKGAYSLRYADSGNISLREAMDIAHGHKHGPNGEEPGEEAGKPHTHDHAAEATHAHDDHDDDHDHDHDHAATISAPAGKAAGNSALVEAMNAAHGHRHGPNGEEPGEEHAKTSNTPGIFTGDSGAIFFGTIAAGELVLLALAVTALRRRKNNGDGV